MDKKELTNNELSIIYYVLETVRNNVTYDKESKSYKENHEEFLLQMSKTEYTTLTRVLNKIA